MSSPSEVPAPFTLPTRAVFATLFVLLLGEAVLLSPSARVDQWDWLIRLLTGDWGAEEPLTVALFNLMGVWPAALLVLLAPRLRRAPVPLWPFAVGSFALGAFSLLPGLAIGGQSLEARGWQTWLMSPLTAILLAIPAIGLFGWGVLAGSPGAFIEQWRTEQFVHVMGLDFLTLWVVSIAIAREDGGRWWLSLLPVVGALAVSATRPRRS